MGFEDSWLESKSNEVSAIDAAKQYVDLVQKRVEGSASAEREKWEVFLNEFAKPLPQFLQENGFGELFDRHLASMRETKDPTELAKRQKALVAEIVSKMKDMPVGTWSCSTRQAIETKTLNCSNAAAILATSLESTKAQTQIAKVEYVNPRGHAMNMVTFSDGRVFYTDPRNGVFEDVTGKIDIEERGDIRIYALRDTKPNMPHHFYPATKAMEDNIVGNYAANMAEIAPTAKGVFDETFTELATPDELSSIQAEAIAAQQREQLTEEKTKQWAALGDRLEKSLRDFYESPDFQSEKELWRHTTNAQAEFGRLGKRLQEEPELLKKVSAAKPMLRAFLLGQTDAIELDDKDFEQTLQRYRDARDLAHSVIHKSPANIEREVDEQIGKL